MNWLYTHVAMPCTQPDRYFGLPGRLRAIRRFERLSEKQQRKEQRLRLQRLLQHAYDTVPYYRQQFNQAHFRPSDARVNAPLPLPILTRDHLRINAKQLLSTSYHPEELRVNQGGGPIGAPIKFYRDVECIRDKAALKLELDAWTGVRAGDSVMMLCDQHRDPAAATNWRWQMPEDVLRSRRITLKETDAGETIERLHQRFEKHRPKVLYGYSSLLIAFASYLRQRRVRHRPKIVITTPELLTDPNRELMKSVFGHTPFVSYGRRDVGVIGAECSEHEGTHIHPWGAYVEFDPIGKNQDGTIYRMLVTDLLNFAQPLIRYDIEDYVTLAYQSCSCGRWFPLVSKVLGHAVPGIVPGNGESVHGWSARNKRASDDGQRFRSFSARDLGEVRPQSLQRYSELNGGGLSA